ARIWDMKGLTIYAGFIDPYVVPGSTNSPVSTGDSEPVTSATLAAGGIGFYGVANQREGASAAPGYEVAKITPDYRSVRDYAPQTKTLEPLRELGFTAGVIAPAKGIIRGMSALVAFSDDKANRVVLKPEVFEH